MFGGWYVIAMRTVTGRPTFVTVIGPTKTREELPALEAARAIVKAADVTFEPMDVFEHSFMLAPTLYEGAFNHKTWINVTRDEWKPT
jgi:hypothetical protein